MRGFVAGLTFGIALQTVAYLFWAFGTFGSLTYPLGNASSVAGLVGWFDISPFSVLVGVGGALAIGIAGLLLRQGTYALYAVLLWGLGQFFPFVKYFFLAIPNTIGALVPGAANPNPSLFTLNPILVVVGVYFAYWGFMFMFGLIFQREMT